MQLCMRFSHIIGIQKLPDFPEKWFFMIGPCWIFRKVSEKKIVGGKWAGRKNAPFLKKQNNGNSIKIKKVGARWASWNKKSKILHANRKKCGLGEIHPTAKKIVLEKRWAKSGPHSKSWRKKKSWHLHTFLQKSCPPSY